MVLCARRVSRHGDRTKADGYLDRQSAASGIRLLRLDTGDLQHEARSLYRLMGFKKIGPYYGTSEQLGLRDVA